MSGRPRHSTSSPSSWASPTSKRSCESASASHCQALAAWGADRVAARRWSSAASGWPAWSSAHPRSNLACASGPGTRAESRSAVPQQRLYFLPLPQGHCALRAIEANLETIVLELLAQGELGKLAGRGVRKLVHEHHILGHPPLRDLALVELEQLLLG